MSRQVPFGISDGAGNFYRDEVSVSSVEIDTFFDFRYRIAHQPLGLDSMATFVLLSFVQLALSSSQCVKRRLHMGLVGVATSHPASFGADR
jgi:hypothetical protein